ncbi:MAG TPA: hypothetical protein VGE76_03460 [Opitutaceae bacterium]
MAVVEYFLLAGLGIWFAVGAAYAFGVRLTLPGRAWALRFRAVVRWQVFGANPRGSASTATYRFEIRDSGSGDAAGPEWKTLAEGHADWSWHGFLWQPQRRLADGLRYFAKVIGGSDEGAGAISAKRGAEAVVSDYLARVSPPGPGQTREVRLIVRRFSAWADRPASAPSVTERTVAFSRESHDASNR